jgi:hypothetical protein
LALVTMTDVAHESVAPDASTAEHITAVMPMLKFEPDGGVHVVVIGATPPVVVGAKVTFTGLPLCETTCVTSGHEMASGAIVGTGVLPAVTAVTVAAELHDAVSCLASVALQVSGVDPTGKSEPDAGEQVEVTGAVPPETVGENVSGIGPPVEDVPDGAGHEIVGALVADGGVVDAPVRIATSADGALIAPVVV